MDFGDLITYVIKLFIDRPNVLRVYAEKFKYILVDEFQDTNFAQNELVNLLAKKKEILQSLVMITKVFIDFVEPQ